MIGRPSPLECLPLAVQPYHRMRTCTSEIDRYAPMPAGKRPSPYGPEGPCAALPHTLYWIPRCTLSTDLTRSPLERANRVGRARGAKRSSGPPPSLSAHDRGAQSSAGRRTIHHPAIPAQPGGRRVPSGRRTARARPTRPTDHTSMHMGGPAYACLLPSHRSRGPVNRLTPALRKNMKLAKQTHFLASRRHVGGPAIPRECAKMGYPTSARTMPLRSLRTSGVRRTPLRPSIAYVNRCRRRDSTA